MHTNTLDDSSRFLHIEECCTTGLAVLACGQHFFCSHTHCQTFHNFSLFFIQSRRFQVFNQSYFALILYIFCMHIYIYAYMTHICLHVFLSFHVGSVSSGHASPGWEALGEELGCVAGTSCALAALECWYCWNPQRNFCSYVEHVVYHWPCHCNSR